MYRFMLIITIFLRVALSTAMTATLAEVNGDVKIRRGLEETWQQAATGITLDEIDTILCVEGKAVLDLENGMTFTLGSHSMLDIGDLRTITRQQLFLYLMSLKIEQLPDRSSQPPARLDRVSVVHGARPDSNRTDDTLWKRRVTHERNGADALFENGLYANAIVKWHKIRQRYPAEPDCGETESLIARSFEKLKETGRAIDAWQRVKALADRCNDPQSVQRAETARERIDMLMP